MKMRPERLGHLAHVALFVQDLPRCEQFYVGLLGMAVHWRPDEKNLYLTNGSDNLALHQWQGSDFCMVQRLDHIGFMVPCEADVDQWWEYLEVQGVPIKAKPRTHRDGARSFYCMDPEGVLVQFLHLPNNSVS